MRCTFENLNRHNLFKLKIHISIYFVYLKFYANDSQGVQVMKAINMYCKSISQVQSGGYSGPKVISLVEHTEKCLVAMQQEMSELLDKQVYVQIEILKIILRGSWKPTKSVR